MDGYLKSWKKNTNNRCPSHWEKKKKKPGGIKICPRSVYKKWTIVIIFLFYYKLYNPQISKHMLSWIWVDQPVFYIALTDYSQIHKSIANAIRNKQILISEHIVKLLVIIIIFTWISVFLG